MAKGKKGPALFEVIRAAQQKQLEQQRKTEQQRTAGPGVLTTAATKLRDLNWLRGRGTGDGAQPAVESPVMREVPQRTVTGAWVEAPASTITSPVVAREPVIREVAPAPVSEPTRAPIDTPAVAPVQAAPVPAEPVAHRPVVTTASEHAPTPAEDIARRVRDEIAAASRIPDTYDDVSPDPVLNNVADLFGPQTRDDDEPAASKSSFKLPFQLNYTTGLAAGIALIVVVSLIVVFAKINGSDPAAPTLADSTPRPDVLNVRPEQAAVAQRTTAVEAPANAARANIAPPQRTVSVESSFQPVSLPPGGKRIIGVQYIVLLSFPREEPAKDLVKFLTAKGVSVTAEKGLPGYSSTWYSVVTTTGFHRTRSNPQYDAFIEPINKLMKEYANGSRFKSFKPDVYTWRAP